MIRTNRKDPTDRCSLASKRKWMRRVWHNPRETRRQSDNAPSIGGCYRKLTVVKRPVLSCGEMLSREKIMAKLTKPARDRISATKFAFPKRRKEPLENASHVRNAVAHFNQVKGVTEAERRAAWKRIQSAPKRYGVDLKSPTSTHTPRCMPAMALGAKRQSVIASKATGTPLSCREA